MSTTEREGSPAIRMPASWNGTISTLRAKAARTSQPGSSRRGAARPWTVVPSGTRGGAGDPTRDVAGQVARDKGTMRSDVAGEEPGDTAANTAGRELRRKATGSAVTSRGFLANPPVRLTGRGGMVAIFALSFAGTFAASVSHVGGLAGISYVVACVLAVWTVRPTRSPGSGDAADAAGGRRGVRAGHHGERRRIFGCRGNPGDARQPRALALRGRRKGTLIAPARGLTRDVHALRESLRGDVRGTGRPH